jgi:hypothetical protein
MSTNGIIVRMSRETSPIFPTSASYEHLVVMINPTAFTAAEAKLETDRLDKEGIIEVEYVNTNPSWEATQEAMLSKVTGRSMIGVIGGDGTKRLVAKGILMVEDEETLPRVPLAFFDGGNVDDGRKAFNGNSPIEDIVLRGINSRIRLIQADLVYPNGDNETDYSVSYDGFGGAAETCRGHGPLKERAKQNWFSELKPVRRTREFGYTATVAGKYAGFYAVEHDGHGNERLFPLQDMTCVHSRQIAEAGITHTDHWEPKMEVFTTVNRGVVRAAGSMVLMGLGMNYGDMTADFTIQVRARDDKNGNMAETVPMQLDGDVRDLPNDTVITMKLSDRELLVRSTRGPKKNFSTRLRDYLKNIAAG